MRSLYLRILLWFGLAMIAATVTSFVVGVIAEREARGTAPPHLVQALGIYAQTAADMAERDGSTVVATYLDRIEKASGMHALFLDGHDSEISGRPVPAKALELARRARAEMKFVNEFSGGVPLNAYPAKSANGAVYVLVAEDNFFRRGPFWIGFRPGFFRFTLFTITRNLLPILVVGGLFCYLLARYLSTPLEQLRGVAQEISDGK